MSNSRNFLTYCNVKLLGRIVSSVAMPIALVATSSALQADWPAFLGGQERTKIEAEVPSQWSPESNIIWKAELAGYGQSSPVVVGDKIYLTSVEGPMKETNLVLCHSLTDGSELWKYELKNSLPVKNDEYTSRAAPTVAADDQGVYAFFESGDTVALAPDGKLLWERHLMDDYGQYVGRFGLGGSIAQLEDSIVILADNEGPSYILALDKESGETLWKTDRTSRTSWSSPMVLVVDGQPQIVVSSAGSVDGYSAADGNLLWSMDDVGGNTVATPVPFGEGKFLVGAAPGRNGEDTEGSRRSNMAVQVVKTDDGFEPKVLWRNEKATSSFGSPIVHDGKAYYVNRAGAVYCIDAETGETDYTARIEESTWATPLGVGDRVYFFGQKGATTVLATGSEHKELAVNRLWEAEADGGGPGGFQGQIQYGVAVTDKGLIVRTGSAIYCISE